MRSTIKCFALAATLLALVACESKGSSLPAEDVPAGTVIGLQGTVSITTPDATRDARQGDVVAGRDIVRTGPESWVRIQLSHNGAIWELGADKERRVADSIAWKAPRDQGDPLLHEQSGPDRSVAAGRHAHRENADTRATIMDPVEGAVPDGVPGGSETDDDGGQVQRDPPRPEIAVDSKKSTRSHDKASKAGSPKEDSTELFQEKSDGVADRAVQPQPDVKARDRVVTADDPTEPVPRVEVDVRGSVAIPRTSPQFAPTPEPKVALRVTRGTLTPDMLETVRKAIFGKLRAQQTCGLVHISTRLSARIGTDGSLTLQPPLPKDGALATCIKAALASWRIAGITPGSAVDLDITITWPEK